MTAILAQPETKEQMLKYGFLPVAQPQRSRSCKDFVKSETVALGQGGARRRHRRIAVALKRGDGP